MSTEFDEADVDELIYFLSTEQMINVCRLTDDKADALSLYQEYLRLASTVMPVVNIIEVSVRNAAHELLAGEIGNSDWLLEPAAFAWKKEDKQKLKAAINMARRSIYSFLKGPDKTHLDRRAVEARTGDDPQQRRIRIIDRRKQIRPTKSHVKKELTFSFWKRLFSKAYEKSLWNTCLYQMFPDRGVSRKLVATKLEKIYIVRNKVAHHEPLYLSDMFAFIKAVKFISKHLTLNFSPGLTPLEKLLQPFVSDSEKDVARWSRLEGLEQ